MGSEKVMKKAIEAEIEVTDGASGNSVVMKFDPKNPIHATAAKTQKLDEKSALKLVNELSNDIEFRYLELGGVLAAVHSNGWFGEHGSFKEFVENETSLSYRKADYLKNIFLAMVDLDIPWEKVAKVGWTKLKELLGVITVDNVDEWVAKAMAMSTIQLIEEVKASLAGTGVSGEESIQAATVKSKTFKFHADQLEIVTAALEKARAAIPTEYDSVALEHICLGYASQIPSAKKGKEQKITAVEPVVDPAVVTMSIGPNASLDSMSTAMETLMAAVYLACGKDDIKATEVILGSYESLLPHIGITVKVPEKD